MKRLLCIILILWGCNLEDSGTQPAVETDVAETAVCNNGIKEIGEQCDSEIPAGKSCEEVGFGSGVALCSAQCELDYSNCPALELCGNNELDEFEECDPGRFEETCQSAGFDEGEIECTNTCSLDTGDCSYICGNGEIAGTEVCDTENFAGKTCASELGQGWNGDLVCSDDCGTVDTSACFEVKPQIISARGFNCRLNYSGKVDCWNAEDVMPNDGTYVKISTGDFHICGLKNDGSVECWGANNEGQSEVPDRTFTDVVADGDFSCGLLADGTILCWGKGNVGQTTPPTGRGFSKLAAGKEHACALAKDGDIQCWGRWDNNSEFRSFRPLSAPFVAVSSGRYYDCGLADDGEPTCWSGDALAQARGPFVKLSTNTFHTCGLRPDGEVKCWGDNQFGKADSQPGPFIDVSTGYYHSCGMYADLSVECWGINEENIDQTTTLYFKGQTTARPAQ